MNPEYSEGRTCCACREPILNTSTIPTCYGCGWAIAQQFESRILAEHRRTVEARITAGQERYRQKRGDDAGGLVYYVRIEDYIKIGFTTRLRSRMNSLRVNTAEALLAVEPGPAELERQRHREFVADRIHTRRENFRPSERLLSHIEALHTAHGLPPWTQRPDTRAVVMRRGV